MDLYLLDRLERHACDAVQLRSQVTVQIIFGVLSQVRFEFVEEHLVASYHLAVLGMVRLNATHVTINPV